MPSRPRSITLTPTVPADLAELYAETAARLPLPLISHLLATAMRRTLEDAGVEPPPLPPPTRTAAATLARSASRREQPGR